MNLVLNANPVGWHAVRQIIDSLRYIKPKKTFRLILNAFKKLLQNFLKQIIVGHFLPNSILAIKDTINFIQPVPLVSKASARD